MKTKLFLSALVLISASLNANELPIVDVNFPGNEKGSYEDITRILKKEQVAFTDKEMDEFKIVTFYKGNNEKDILNSEKNYYEGNKFHTLGEVLTKGKSAYTKEELDSLGKLDVGPAQRFYFGNKNIVQDISYLNENNYDIKKQKLTDENKDKYIVEGGYKVPYLTKQPVGVWANLVRKINPLNMTVDDYNENIKGKSKEKVLLYLKNKLAEGNVKTYIEEGKIYTKDDNGKKWPVLWDIKPIRTRLRNKIIETVWGKIHVYVPNSKSNSAFGNIAYSKEGSIYLEDKLDYTSNLKIKAEEVFNYKTNYTSLPSIEYGKVSKEGVEKIIEIYSEDKDKVLDGTLSEKDFDKKWGKIRTEYFDDRYKLTKGEITESEFLNIWDPKNINKENLEKDNLELKNLEKVYNGTNHYARGAWDIRGNTDLSEIEEIFDREMAKIEADLIKYDPWPYGEKAKKELTEFYNAYRVLLIKQKDFYNKYKAALLDSNVILSNKSKKLNLVGQGRINGTVNMGQGFNTLVITEPGTGKYGSNIIFGPYSKLENIQVLEAGKAYAKKDGEESISGDYSMMMDIDENVKNLNGEIDQHLFKNTDSKLIVKPWSSLEKDFKIGLIVSRLNKDEVLNMGRKLYSSEIKESKNTSGEIKKENKVYDITFISDSIAHKLFVKDKEAGTIDVKIKDKIEGLNNKENKVYQSIKNAKIIGKLSETLTTSNKTTIFGGNRETESLNELKFLIDEMRVKNIYSYLGKVSKDSSDTFKYIPFEKNKNVKKGVYVNGGSISNRFAKDSIKGNIYSGYGVYENDFKGYRLGGIIGGTKASYEENLDKNLDKVFTNSKIKGTSAYLGSYLYKDISNKLSLINGLGLQYGEYNTTRNLKNNYQNFEFKSKTKVNDLNLYSGLLYNINLKNNMSIKLKGILSYDFIMQGEVSEDEKVLGMEIKDKNFSFVDGELGIGLGKILYSDNSISELTGEVAYKYGFIGYDDENLIGKIKGSTSDFNIERQNLDKEFAKLILKYDVKRDSGLTYGISGEFSKSKEAKNIVVKLNAGYTL